MGGDDERLILGIVAQVELGVTLKHAQDAVEGVERRHTTDVGRSVGVDRLVATLRGVVGEAHLELRVGFLLAKADDAVVSGDVDDEGTGFECNQGSCIPTMKMYV